MILAIYILASINLLVLIGCYRAMANSAPATFDGFGASGFGHGLFGLKRRADGVECMSYGFRPAEPSTSPARVLRGTALRRAADDLSC